MAGGVVLAAGDAETDGAAAAATEDARELDAGLGATAELVETTRAR